MLKYFHSLVFPRIETSLAKYLYRRSKNQNQRDDVDFFFNENNNRGGGGTTAKSGVMGLARQDSKDSIDNYFKVSRGCKNAIKIQFLSRVPPSRPVDSPARTFSTQAVQEQEFDLAFIFRALDQLGGRRTR